MEVRCENLTEFFTKRHEKQMDIPKAEQRRKVVEGPTQRTGAQLSRDPAK